MVRKTLVVALSVFYLLCFLAGLIFYLAIEGSFSPASRLFWAQTGLPPLILLLHLAAGIMLLWRFHHAAPLVVAVELMVLVAGVCGLGLFLDSFKWIMLALVPRACAAGVLVHYFYAPFSRGRQQMVLGAIVGALLGAGWLLALRPLLARATPAWGPGEYVRVWEKAVAHEGESQWTTGIPLAGDLHVGLLPDPLTLTVRHDRAQFIVAPLVGLQRITTDGFWSTPLNTVGMVLMSGGKWHAWTEGNTKYVYCRYDHAERARSRFARGSVEARFPDEIITGELYVRADMGTGDVDAVALTRLRRPVPVHESTFFEATALPYVGQAVLLPNLGRLGFEKPVGGRLDPAHELVNVQGSQAVLYRSGDDSEGPFREVARSDDFPDAAVFEDFAPGKSLVFYFPDWRTQVAQQPSPGAGEPLRANCLDCGLTRRRLAEVSEVVVYDGLKVRASLADASFGKGRAVILLPAGLYVNRMAIRLVPKQDDYGPLIRSIKLWALSATGSPAP